MSIKKVSIKKLGRDYKISPHFKLSEFACKDGSDTVLYSTELFEKLEELRAWIDGEVTIGINSGFRTASYNKKIGGASGSQHTQGTAADIVVKQNGKRISGKLICCICQDLGFNGVALIKGSGYSVHLDVANRTYRGDENHGYSNNVGGDFYKYFGISKSQVTALKAKKEEEEMAQATKNGVSDWAKEAMAEAIKRGITDGSRPQDPATREEVISMIIRALKG